jgi:aconitase B
MPEITTYTFTNKQAKAAASAAIDAAIEHDRIAYLRSEVALLRAHMDRGMPEESRQRANRRLSELDTELERIGRIVRLIK